MSLEHAGHDVVLTRDPREVDPLARESRFDAVILDVMAPLSGFDVLSELRGDAATAALPVLMLSGRGEGPDRVRGLREGADDYLVKPFDPEELALRVERLIAWRSPSAKVPPAQQEAPHADPSSRYMGRYEVQGVIGEGTMGTVYRGWDPRLRRAGALKTIRFDSIAVESQRREMRARLRHEAVTVALFNHPNIVAVYDMGDTADSAFIAMELVDGVSLARYLDKVGAVAAPRLIPLALGVARALATAHRREVIHRDVKPGNVLLGRDGAVKVTDFGVAYIFSRVSDEPMLSGTPGYVPPEALREGPYTEAGDLYGLGAMLYEAAAGVHPLAGSSLRQTIDRTLAGNVMPLAERQDDLPPDFAHLVMALLAPQPDRRPTAAAVVELLEQAVAEGDLEWRADDLPGDP